MRKVLKKGVPAFIIVSALTISACSVGSDETMNEMDTPPVNYVEEGDSLGLEDDEQSEGLTEDGEGNEDASGKEQPGAEATEMTTRELYLLDENGLVVPQALQLPKQEGVLKQSLEYLVEDGPVTNLLPNGFRAVLPPGTEVDVNLTEDGVAIADFSNEFKEYKAEDELKVLQAITWTLTQFDNVEKVQIRINGYEQDKMPVNGTPIGDGMSRANGINIETDNVVDVVSSKEVTLYFLAQSGENTYYVPVTRRVNATSDELTAAVEELLKGPSHYSNLVTDFRQGVALLEEPQNEDGVVTLNFNEALLSQLQSTAVSEKALNMLALTLTEQEGIEKVAIQVNGESNALNESGQLLAEPVTRPTQVNTGKF
ncbi:GerMN domain-containing protein [Halalkalibacterium ligniniphilum]|uniref:GerMN domain-containing protein n=1 Tax=Halalkalibacterium ligniniphilum TaxID=1134413 RepID=UPI0003490C4D|nr:GerMN domain-containing protein [Halalkalibacterium ligniniphilum]